MLASISQQHMSNFSVCSSVSSLFIRLDRLSFLDKFPQLASQYGFEIVTSSPRYPHGHRFVERQVQMVKKTILKCRETKEEIELALLAL